MWTLCGRKPHGREVSKAPPVETPAALLAGEPLEGTEVASALEVDGRVVSRSALRRAAGSVACRRALSTNTKTSEFRKLLSHP